MRTIIAGSRTITDYHVVNQAIFDSGFIISEVVSGCAKGVDKLGELWAKETDKPIRQFPADWLRNGKGAGYIRNAEMAKYADALIAIWDGKSKGTKNMIDMALRHNLKLHITEIDIITEIE